MGPAVWASGAFLCPVPRGQQRGPLPLEPPSLSLRGGCDLDEYSTVLARPVDPGKLWQAATRSGHYPGE